MNRFTQILQRVQHLDLDALTLQPMGVEFNAIRLQVASDLIDQCNMILDQRSKNKINPIKHDKKYRANAANRFCNFRYAVRHHCSLAADDR